MARFWLAVALTAGVLAGGVSAAPLYRVACGQKSFLVTFSNDRGVRVAVGQENLVRATSSNAAWAKRCKTTGDFSTDWDGGPSRRTTAPISIFCKAPVVAEFKVVNYQSSAGTGAAFAATLAHSKQMFVLAKLYKQGASELRWDTRYCKPGSGP